MRRLAVWSWPSMHLPPETYLGAIWPAQAQPALRGLVRAWHAARDTDLAAIPAGIADPLILEFRRAVRSTLGECLPGIFCSRNPQAPVSPLHEPPRTLTSARIEWPTRWPTPPGQPRSARSPCPPSAGRRLACTPKRESWPPAPNPPCRNRDAR